MARDIRRCGQACADFRLWGKSMPGFVLPNSVIWKGTAKVGKNQLPTKFGVFK